MKRNHEIQDDSFVTVGYGGVPTFPPPIIEFDLLRRFASTPYAGLTRNNLHLHQNPNPAGAGGTCFGDSGGPHFWEDSLMLVSVTSWGDAICRSNDMTQRLDISSATWLARTSRCRLAAEPSGSSSASAAMKTAQLTRTFKSCSCSRERILGPHMLSTHSLACSFFKHLHTM